MEELTLLVLGKKSDIYFCALHLGFDIGQLHVRTPLLQIIHGCSEKSLPL